ncbi:membrane metallo-endopeptidase-like 1 isoform X2 [Cotesia typhae]|uniref:membrane metallo-endopeptidase-like 1 isoform X2 n=1 Tax=Cotesia typhae TaxID=2053667 RepID=UPI003D69FC27
MPSGSYEVTQKPNTHQNNDQSYKNCIITMILFVMMCIIIILATWPWKGSNIDYKAEESIEQFETDNESKFERLEELLTSTSSSKEDKKTEEFESSSESFGFSTSSSELSESSSWIDIESSSISNDNIGFSSSPEEFSSSPLDVETSTASYDSTIGISSSSLEALETSSLPVDNIEASSESNYIFLGFSSSSVDLPTTSEEYTSEFSESPVSEDDKLTSESTSYSPEDSSIKMSEATIFSSTENNLDEDTSVSPSTSGGYSFLTHLTFSYFKTDFTSDALDSNSTTNSPENEETKSTAGDSSETFRFTKEITQLEFSSPTSNNPTVFTTQNGVMNDENQLASRGLETTTFKSKEELPVCMSGQCKQLSSKILSYINHSANPCDDFYEYACGGMEADPEINNVDLSMQVLKKIKSSMKNSMHHPEHFTFIKYVNSCLGYDEYLNKNQRIVQAKETLKSIGTFYTASDWPKNFELTQLISNMILYNPILFDIVPDVNEMNPQEFILSLQPPDNLSKYFDQTPCIEDLDNLSDEIDLDKLYNNYKSCKNNTRELGNSVTRALKAFGIFEEFTNSDNVTEYINEISIDIHHQIIKALISNYPPESEINASYKSKDYDLITLSDLEDHLNLLNWTQLISSTTGMTLKSDDKIQIYFKENLFRVLNTLEQFSRMHLRELNNALLGLYARNLYNELVEMKSSKDSEENCFINAMKYLPKETSSLYISSFSKNELDHINSVIQKIFTELKDTLKINFEHSEWAAVEGRYQLIEKLEGLKLSIPDIAYFNSNLKLHLTDDYFNNTIELMKNYRREMYNILQLNPNNPEQIWTYFAKSYQSTPKTLYSLNLILIPLGAINWPLIQKYDQSFDYLILSNIGNLIAREIADCFDPNGIKYWNGTRDSPFALIDDVFTKTNYDDYVNCQNQSLFQEPIHMILSSHNQHIRFMMPQLTLNSRLSDAMGIKLAHDTLARVGSTSAKLLPWLNLNIDQLFYLTYAQSYCTKISMPKFLISLYENTILPSRVQIYATATNNKAFGELWNCPEGSQLLPNFSCRVFPKLEYQSVVIETA